MSNNGWRTCHSPLAGPDYPSSPASTGSGSFSRICSASHESQPQKSYDSDAVALLDQFSVSPQLWFSVNDTQDLSDADAYNTPYLQLTLSSGDETKESTSSLNMQQLRSYSDDICESKAHDTVEDKNSEILASHHPVTFSFEYHDQLQDSPSSSALPPLLEDSSESPLVVPNLEESEGLFWKLDSSSLVLSPYVPMPLPPIFCHEGESKLVPMSMDITPSSYASLLMSRVPIDPSLESPTQHQMSDTCNPFARGSTVVGSLWPPASPPPPFAQVELFISPEVPELALQVHCSPQAEAAEAAPAQIHSYSFPDSKPLEQACHSSSSADSECPNEIPLEVAASYAAAFRATGTNVSLSLPFLMQFLGQPAGQTKWHCYIRGCGKKLTRKGHMVDHVKMHLDERSFTCDHCSQTFLRKADCKRHAATHNPTKGFPCGLCPKSYARKDLLTRHIRICQRQFEDSEPRAGSGYFLKKKRLHSNIHADSQYAHEIPEFVSPDMLFMPQGGHGGDKELQLWVCSDENKENISPQRPNVQQVLREGERTRKRRRQPAARQEKERHEHF